MPAAKASSNQRTSPSSKIASMVIRTDRVHASLVARPTVKLETTAPGFKVGKSEAV